MRVKCTSNLGAALSLELKESIIYADIPDNHKFHVVIGSVYSVLALSVVNGHTYFGIWSDDQLRFQLLPADLFTITDNRISQFWRITYEKADSDFSSFTFLGHPETANNREHINGLLEGQEQAIAILDNYRELIELEFSDPSIKLTAEAIDGEWLLCPNCYHAWENQTKLELVKCPSCGTLMNNPIK